MTLLCVADYFGERVGLVDDTGAIFSRAVLARDTTFVYSHREGCRMIGWKNQRLATGEWGESPGCDQPCGGSRRAWHILVSDGAVLDNRLSFENVVLHPGDSLVVTYMQALP
jgi:hypothetical protein